MDSQNPTPIGPETVEQVVRMCNDGSKDHDLFTMKVLAARDHVRRSLTHQQEADNLLAEAFAPSMRGGGTFAAIRQYLTGTGSGLNKVPKALPSLFFVCMAGLSLTLVAASPVRIPEKEMQSIDPLSRINVRDRMIADAKCVMVAGAEDRKVRLKKAEAILTRVATQYGYTDDVLMDLLFCRYELKDLTGLRYAISRADERSCYAHTFKGRLLLDAGKKADAKSEFEQAIQKGDTKAFYLLRSCN